MNFTIEQNKQLLSATSIYAQHGGESYRVNFCDETGFYATRENSGDECFIDYNDVNPVTDKFLKLVEINPTEMVKQDITKLTAREITNLINLNYTDDVITTASFECTEECEDGWLTAIYACTDSQSIDEDDTFYVYVTEANGKLEADY